MRKETLKQALEYVESVPDDRYAVEHIDRDKLVADLGEALAKPDFWEGYVPEPDKRQQALDKKAENARELGLDYEPARDSGIVTAGGADPRTQRTWVGLTDEEFENAWSQSKGDVLFRIKPFALAVEARLKEKNNG